MKRLKPSCDRTMTPSASPLVEHRHDEHRLGDVVGALDRLAARVVEGVVDEERLAVLGHPAGEPLADGHPQRRHGVRGVAVQHRAREGDRVAQAALAVNAIDADVVVIGQRAGLRDDRLADGADVRQPVEARREVLDGAHAGRRPPRRIGRGGRSGWRRPPGRRRPGRARSRRPARCGRCRGRARPPRSHGRDCAAARCRPSGSPPRDRRCASRRRCGRPPRRAPTARADRAACGGRASGCGRSAPRSATGIAR